MCMLEEGCRLEGCMLEEGSRLEVHMCVRRRSLGWRYTCVCM